MKSLSADGVRCQSSVEYRNKVVAKHLFEQLFCFVLLCFYIRLMFIFLTRKKMFSGTFYKIMIVNGISVCMFQIANSTFSFITTLALFGIGEQGFQEPTLYKALLLFCMYSSGTIASIGMLFLSLNRLSAIVLMNQYEMLWNRLFPYVISIEIVIPLIAFGQLVFADVSFFSVCYGSWILDYATMYANEAPFFKYWSYLATAVFLDAVVLLT
ncbi:hypothetical protein M3Y95_00272200 [Aphelenchoides besseyi]|nr:hypothetical protein M3Y95_00272200 [Aphelenchoides besseyi]